MADEQVKRMMLSTIDNPFNPFTEWDKWLAYDESQGYYSSNFLARIANYSDDLSDLDQIIEKNRAIDEIIENDVTGKFIRVVDHF